MYEGCTRIRPLRSLHNAIVVFLLLPCLFIASLSLTAHAQPETLSFSAATENPHSLQGHNNPDDEKASTTSMLATQHGALVSSRYLSSSDSELGLEPSLHPEKGQTERESSIQQTAHDSSARQTVHESSTRQNEQESSTSHTEHKFSTSQTEQEFSTSQTEQEFSTRQTEQESSTNHTEHEFSTRQNEQESSTNHTEHEFSTSQTEQEFSTSQTEQESSTRRTAHAAESGLANVLPAVQSLPTKKEENALTLSTTTPVRPSGGTTRILPPAPPSPTSSASSPRFNSTSGVSRLTTYTPEVTPPRSSASSPRVSGTSGVSRLTTYTPEVTPPMSMKLSATTLKITDNIRDTSFPISPSTLSPTVPGPVPTLPEPSPTLPEPSPTLPEPLPTLPGPLPTLPGPLPTLPGPLPTLPGPLPTLPGPLPTLPGPLPTLPGPFPTLPEPFQPCSVRGEMTPIVMNRNIAWKFDWDDCVSESTWWILVPDSYGIVVDFHHVEMARNDSLTIVSVGATDLNEHLVRYFQENSVSVGKLAPALIGESLMKIELRAYDGKRTLLPKSSFNLTYTAHPKAGLPRSVPVDNAAMVESIINYNCSGVNYLPASITCDGIRHCTDGEDEESCLYRDEGCGDWFPSGNQCFKAIFVPVKGYASGHSFVTMPTEAEAFCQSQHGATLATLQGPGMMETAVNMIRKSGFLQAVVGIQKFKPVSRNLKHLYRFLWQWGDRGSPIAYDQEQLQKDGTSLDCAMLNVWREPVFRPLACVLPNPFPDGFICMRSNPAIDREKLTLSGLAIPPASELPTAFSTKACPDGSVVQTFHRCQWEQRGEDTDSGWSQNGLPLFQCRYGPAVHYSLLCDGKDDCADRSDEMDCKQPQFPPLVEASFICRNLQAIPDNKRCDGAVDCFDESDEESCVSCNWGLMCPGEGCLPDKYGKYVDSCPMLAPHMDGELGSTFPGKVVLDGYGMSRLYPVSGDCGVGFYQCQGGHCIPSFLLNNGEQDCPEGEDEHIPLRNMTCPGYYRCQGSGSCVHKDFVCDGVFHCPNKDDEMYCHLACPAHLGCTCEGHAYKCPAMIDPLHNLHLRYLDLSHAANVSLENVHLMEYLFVLNVSHCGLGQVNLSTMLSLQTLDLSFNFLTGLASLNLDNVPGLTYLDLSGNPLMETLGTAFTSKIHVGGFNNLITLIMTGVGLGEIENESLSPLSKLKHLDIRANAVRSFGKQALSGLTALTQLKTDQPKLCCTYFHPSLTECVAPVDELSSCDDLLAQDFFRVCLWTLAVLAVVGNVGVLIYRLFVRAQNSAPTSRILIKNLCASDLLMGIYMTMIGVADAQFRGVYVVKENEWKDSVACTSAGFLSFVSSEVSAFVICLITLDRVLVICFPFNKSVHLTRKRTILACCGVWVVCIALASVPLIAGMDFYGQNGICIPLPITRQQFSGQSYAFGVFIVLNFIIFVFIGVGQVTIYCAVRRASRAAGTRRQEQDMTVARRLFLIVLTDFCCWFPIGVMGLLAALGFPIPGEVNVWVAIFVLPLNSALNPFLYTINGLLEKWRQLKMEKTVKKTLGKLQSEIPRWQPANVQELMRICVRSKLVGQDKMMKIMSINDGPSPVTRGKEDLSIETEDQHEFEGFSDFSTGTTDIANSKKGFHGDLDASTGSTDIAKSKKGFHGDLDASTGTIDKC